MARDDANGPADGRNPFHWRNMVQAQRGGPAMAGVAQPELDVGLRETVTPLDASFVPSSRK